VTNAQIASAWPLRTGEISRKVAQVWPQSEFVEKAGKVLSPESPKRALSSRRFSLKIEWATVSSLGDHAMRLRRYVWALCFCIAGAINAPGCVRQQPTIGPPTVPATPISKPEQGDVVDFVEFTGRTDAVEAVDVRARVTGYLEKLLFKEGSDVKKGDVLFEVDPRPYKAQYDQAVSQVELYKSSYKLAQITYKRDLALAATQAVSPQQLDQDRAAMDEAEARVNAYKASLEIYQLNLDFTKVKSPVDGKISRYYLTKGNLINQDQTLLTTVVSLDPMFVYFDMDEQTLLLTRRATNEGRMAILREGTTSLGIGLAGEEGFPHEAVIDFINNQVNAATGSISVRARMPNAKPADGVRLLSPGMFVRVRLPIGPRYTAMLVIDRAILSDQGLKKVYVVDDQNTVQERRVKTGALQENGLRVIMPDSELKPNEWVVVGGLQQVRPKMTVEVDKVTMPRFNQPVTQSGDKASDKKKQ
jgi:membrane fusion protein, multidrug efflux system